MCFDHFVFIDFENSPEVDLELIAGKSTHVALLIGKKQARLPTELSIQLNTFAPQARPIRLGESGHNALDLTLAYYLGQAAQQWPLAEFHVVSKDHDFDPMIRHLVGSKINVRRCETFQQLPFLDPIKPPARSAPAAKSKPASATTKPAQDRREKLLARLTDPAHPNKPSTEKALRAHIKTALGKTSSEDRIEDMMRHLKQKGLAIQPGGKLLWPGATRM